MTELRVMIFLNSAMKPLYDNRKSTMLSKRLTKLINSGVIFEQGFYFFKSFYKKNENIDVGWIHQIYTDESGFECVVNKFHLDDYCNESFISFEQVANISFTFLSYFESYWKENFKDTCVFVIGIDLNSEFAPDAVIRFHKKRTNQIVYDPSGLEGFVGQAVMIAEIYP